MKNYIIKNSDDINPKAIQSMFDDISNSYDRLNGIISFNRDRHWRRKCVEAIKPQTNDTILDLACGTGSLIKAIQSHCNDCNVIGGDFSLNMLKVCKKNTGVYTVNADACALPFRNEVFDKITIAFGFRNIADKEKALQEMYRVLKPGGTVAILELSKPKSRIFSPIYWFYFKVIMPQTGKIMSGHKNAYKYLPVSVLNFPDEETYKKMTKDAGYSICKLSYFDFGICSLMLLKK